MAKRNGLKAVEIYRTDDVLPSAERLADVEQRLGDHGVQVPLLDDEHATDAIARLVEQAYGVGYAAAEARWRA